MIRYDQKMSDEDRRTVEAMFFKGGLIPTSGLSMDISRCKKSGRYKIVWNGACTFVVDKDGTVRSKQVTSERGLKAAQRTALWIRHTVFFEKAEAEETDGGYLVTITPKPLKHVNVMRSAAIPKKDSRGMPVYYPGRTLDGMAVVTVDQELIDEGKEMLTEWLADVLPGLQRAEQKSSGLFGLFPSSIHELLAFGRSITAEDGGMRPEACKARHEITQSGTIEIRLSNGDTQCPAYLAYDPFAGKMSAVKLYHVNAALRAEKLAEIYSRAEGLRRAHKKRFSENLRTAEGYGAIKLTASFKNFSREYIFRIGDPCLDRAFEAADRDIESAIEEDRNITHRIRYEEQRRIQDSAIRGSLLTEAIYGAVQANGYLSASKLSAIIRGKSTGGKASRESRHADGMKHITDAAVISAAEEMVGEGILDTRSVYGTYRRYRAYIIAANGADMYRRFMQPAEDGRYDIYRDIDWLREIRSGNPGGSWDQRLRILDCPNVYYADPDAVTEYFRDAPESVAAYLKLTARTETGLKKKVAKQLYDALTAETGSGA